MRSPCQWIVSAYESASVSKVWSVVCDVAVAAPRTMLSRVYGFSLILKYRSCPVTVVSEVMVMLKSIVFGRPEWMSWPPSAFL